LDKSVLFNWGSDPQSVNATESSDIRGFKFQGYNVYQLPSASATISEARKIAVFDIAGDGITRITDQVFDPTVGVVTSKVVQLGTDSGIKRSLTVTGDAFNGGNPLINGIKYYFAVTSYSYSADPNAVPNNLENPLTIITVVPHSPNPGVRYQGKPGDTLAVAHTVAAGGSPSDGQVVPLVLDPSRATGDQYQVVFQNDATTGETSWSVKDVTKNTVVLASQTNQSGDDNYLFVDGLQVKVIGPPPGMKDFAIPSGARRWTFAGADWGLEGFSGAMGMAYNNWFSSSTVTPDKLHNVLLKLADTDDKGNLTDPNDPNASYAYRYLRGAANPPAKPEFAPFILNPGPGYAFQEFKKGIIPFAAFDEENGNQRLAVGLFENNTVDGLVDGKYWPGASDDGVNNVNTREFFFVFSTPYSETQDNALAVDILNNTVPIMWWGAPNIRGANTVRFEAGDEFEIIANHINSPADVFTFTAPSVTNDPALAKNDVGNINVFPNPYYGVNTEELNKYQRFVTFSHLPQRATIKVFNLAGIQVRTIQKNSTSQFERWDLANESGLPVGSGLYIVHIDMPDIGAQKILKLAIVQEQQILDRF
jgi:hypothetical protein